MDVGASTEKGGRNPDNNLHQSCHVKFPLVTMNRFPLASSLSNVCTCASARSRTSTHDFGKFQQLIQVFNALSQRRRNLWWRCWGRQVRRLHVELVRTPSYVHENTCTTLWGYFFRRTKGGQRVTRPQSIEDLCCFTKSTGMQLMNEFSQFRYQQRKQYTRTILCQTLGRSILR